MHERRTIRLLFGREGMSLSAPASATILEGKSPTPLADPVGAVREALAHPIGSDSLIELARRRHPRTVAITISDITRPVPNRLLVTAILQDLAAAGIGDQQVTIIIGTGMHRPSTSAEKEEMLGADILGRCQVVDHHPDDAANFVRLSEDPPV
jgi:lactate racemase